MTERKGRGAGRGTRELVAGLLLAAVTTAHPASSQEAGTVSGAHVRAGDPKAADLLALGVTASPTFRLLVETLERSDLIVYVQARPMSLPGQLQFAAFASRFRYLRVSVRVPGRDADLQRRHAVELASAPEVIDQDSLIRYYERIGMRRSAGAVETVAAQQAWRKILDEAKFGR